ncbi:hypothetical protein BJ508DRAFT_309942 [Ascobolus immersus RN42]|uniref:Uncharacterized protein n=1 Tax=Ascobolus immersus RN42 TaxID=1160509 RepID=A0A3N4HV37_ASCIM|nr:hypothetical protein BJ508DRAFT_309942 [Ascobolus immersus RN42]
MASTTCGSETDLPPNHSRPSQHFQHATSQGNSRQINGSVTHSEKITYSIYCSGTPPPPEDLPASRDSKVNPFDSDFLSFGKMLPAAVANATGGDRKLSRPFLAAPETAAHRPLVVCIVTLVGVLLYVVQQMSWACAAG